MKKPAKIALMVLSFVVTVAVFSLITSFKLSAIVFTFIALHEFGHTWAGYRAGSKSGGIFFIPFLGGVSIGTGKFKNRLDEFCVVFYGPAVGFAVILTLAAAYLMTGSEHVLAACAVTTLVNTFNLLPLGIVDGGRMLRSITMSVGRAAGMASMVFMIMLALLFLPKFAPVAGFFVIMLSFLDMRVEVMRHANQQAAAKMKEWMEKHKLCPILVMSVSNCQQACKDGECKGKDECCKVSCPIAGSLRSLDRLMSTDTSVPEPMTVPAMAVSGLSFAALFVAHVAVLCSAVGADGMWHHIELLM